MVAGLPESRLKTTMAAIEYCSSVRHINSDKSDITTLGVFGSFLLSIQKDFGSNVVYLLSVFKPYDHCATARSRR